ncbi:MAG: hypothetical protein ACPG5T_07165 [Endozoicomonas sp.]
MNLIDINCLYYIYTYQLMARLSLKIAARFPEKNATRHPLPEKIGLCFYREQVAGSVL